MKVLPKELQLQVKLNENYITLVINNNYKLKYYNTKNSNNDILQDLLECNAYATTLLYLNENYKLEVDKNNYLINKSNIEAFYEDCEELLNKNITIVEEVGIPLCDINGYKIFEGAGYILRGNGKKKIKESFINEIIGYKELTKSQFKKLAKKYGDRVNDYDIKMQNNKFYISNLDYNALVDEEPLTEDGDLDLFPAIKEKVLKLKADGTSKADIEDFILGQVRAYSIDKEEANQLKQLLTEDGEGTQTTDIAPKVDQDMNRRTTNKKKHYDILLSGLDEGLPIINKGFLKNSDGQYQRGNYILVKEGEQYLAVHKDKLNGGIK